ncbi:MAG TPA: helix-turn-helix domain-containing protein [Solirubrobacteraceae bacterium]|jgi:AcrR family transcriptional regulator|nr:helix-turn-helix domain-containing protein [Solirubrobacteraceae bacterium]
MRRLNRVEQTRRNRELLLTAARRVFMARGYHGATLERIADEAGFSKGVVYSQFRDKADLFLILLEARIEARLKANAEVVREARAEAGMKAFLEQGIRVIRAEPEWGLAVLEFRLHAARDPELNGRYLALHERAIQGLAAVFAEAYERAGEELPLPAVNFAEALFALGTGVELEQAHNPTALEGPLAGALVSRLLSSEPAASKPRSAKRRRAA